MPLLKTKDGILVQADWETVYEWINKNIHEYISNKSTILGFGSASATNETLYMMKKYIESLGGTSRLEFRTKSEDKEFQIPEDKFLRRMDKHPNTAGAIRLGFISGNDTNIEEFISDASSGKIRCGIVIFQRPLINRPGGDIAESRIAELIRHLEFSIVMSSHRSEWMESASALLPIAAWTEEAGTFVNFDGRLQRAERAVSSPGSAKGASEIFSRLIASDSDDKKAFNPSDIFSEICAMIPSFSGLRWDDTALPGILLK
jgi:predicted molibdopterin-dependent oxidoreductase YjgC